MYCSKSWVLNTHAGVEWLLLANLSESTEQSRSYMTAQVFFGHFSWGKWFNYSYREKVWRTRARNCPILHCYTNSWTCPCYLQFGNMNLISLTAAWNDLLPWRALCSSDKPYFALRLGKSNTLKYICTNLFNLSTLAKSK